MKQQKNPAVKAVIPGSYNPITNGHLDLIRRAAALFSEVTVLICVNSSKNVLLSADDRLALARDAVKALENVTVDVSDGLFADYCTAHGIGAVVKGVRSETDYRYETDLVGYNRAIFADNGSTPPETVFLPASADFAYCSSTFVREMLHYHHPVDAHVPNAALLEQLLCGRAQKEKE